MSLNRRGKVALGCLLAAAVLLSACGGATATDSATADSEPVAGEQASSSGDEAQLVLPTASGGQLVFNDLVGSPALLWFWAPW